LGRFRADLFYRLNTVEIALPPLRARVDFATIARAIRGTIAPDSRIDDGAIATLRRLPWLGNIREFKSMLTRLTPAKTAGVITSASVSGLSGPAADPPVQATLRTVLHESIRAVHQETAGNISETARRLHVSRNTIYRALPKASREAD
jgi:transcriptional regulator of acetoin/glycerol metabolism